MIADENTCDAGGGAAASGSQGRERTDALRDLSALQALEFDYPVVAVKFSMTEPAHLPRLSKRVALCEMLREAQEVGAFYASKDEQGCRAGSFVLGQVAHDPVAESGRVGEAIGVYESAEGNKRIYSEMVRFSEGAAPYVLFARLEELSFDPDLLIVTARPTQAEVLVRAHGYKTGSAWETRGTTVIACACLYSYPYLTGKMNILISGLHHGMRARDLFPEGLLFVAIPSALLQGILESLAAMADRELLDLPQYHWGKEAHEKYMRSVFETIAQQQGFSS